MPAPGEGVLRNHLHNVDEELHLVIRAWVRRDQEHVSAGAKGGLGRFSGEPLTELPDVGNRLPHARPRGAKQSLAFDLVHLRWCYKQPPGCIIARRGRKRNRKVDRKSTRLNSSYLVISYAV